MPKPVLTSASVRTRLERRIGPVDLAWLTGRAIAFLDEGATAG